ncbi:MAG: biosynthetic-type acetolactate synthase large subunit [bacterium]|nr:biosynthetic-type acetolactate synthase large subunit [bacterium]
MTNFLVSGVKENKSNGTVLKKNKNFICAGALVETLVELNTDTIFGYPGASVLSIYNELSHVESIKHVLVRHEQAAVHAAEGYARAGGKTGVVLVTSGPGFTNTLTGLANAYADSTPLVVFAGDVTKSNNKGKIFQKVDIPSMAKNCTKKIFTITSKDDIKQVTKEAFEVANSGGKGPVLVVIPRNILESKYSPKISKNIHIKKKLPLKDSDLDKAIKLLFGAKNPLILIGGGAVGASSNIKKLVSKTKIPVISTLMGIGSFPSSDKNYLGMIGINGSYLANTALNNSDFILALGVSFSDRSTCRKIDFGKKAKITSVNLKQIYRNFDLEITSDVNLFLEGLLYKLSNVPKYDSWHSAIRLLKEEYKEIENDSGYLHSSFVLKTIYEYTKNYDPVVVTDVGQHQMVTTQYFHFNKPKKFITSGGLGTMGFGLPASIGAQLSKPDSLVLNITGDGSFQMNLQELATCREHAIPVKIIIMNNGYLGMVRQLQDKIYNNRYQVEMINPDFTKIAEAYDLFAIRVVSKDALVPALEQAISHKGTAIVDIAIDSDEEI